MMRIVWLSVSDSFGRGAGSEENARLELGGRRWEVEVKCKR